MSAPQIIPIHMRWSDQDALGHVNNATFLTLLEEARIRGMDQWFGGLDLASAPMLVARQEIEYTAQLGYRSEPIDVAIWVSSIGASSFDIAYEVRDADTRYCIAESTLVRFDLEGGHPCRLSPEERAALEACVGGPAPFRRRRA